MKKTYFSFIIREIRGSFSRFIAIFAIIALGTGFLSGLLATTPDMKASTDKYYDDNNMMDLRVVSTAGLTNDDILSLKSIDGVGSVMPCHTSDQTIEQGTKLSETARIHSIPSNSQDYVNQLILTDGRLPEQSNECVILNDNNFDNKVNLNDTITISESNKDYGQIFNSNEFKVVGFVNSPYYISIQNESTNIGNGYVDTVMYVNEDAYKTDYYTDAFITVPEATDENCFYDNYFQSLDSTKNKIQDISSTRCKDRYDEIVSSANLQINTAQSELDRKKQETQAQLNVAKMQLDESCDQMNTALDEINNGQNEIDNAKTELLSKQNELEIQKEKLDLEKNELNDKSSQYYTAINELDSQKSKSYQLIQDKQNEISINKQNVKDYQEQLDLKKADLNQLSIQIDNIGIQINELYEQGKIEQAKELEQVLYVLQEQYNQLDSYIQEKQQEIYNQGQSLDYLQTKLDEEKSDVDNKFSQTENYLDEQYDILTASNSKFYDYNKALDEAEIAINNANAELENKQNDIVSLKNDLQTKQVQLNNSLELYNQNSNDISTTFDEAQQKIDNSKDELCNIPYPQWYVLDRNSNVGYVNFVSNVDKVKSIATVFPVFFFLVAALVALTTMSRMVEQERIQIGTLKALGYKKITIALNYIVYAGVASLLGSIIGMLVGFKIFPTLIWNAYKTLYILPDITAPVIPSIAISIGACAVLGTILVAIISSYNELKEVPSSLMQAKAPKPGKRILLERIPFIWSHLSFIKKVTARNIFRYKKRFFMTVIGIAGCTTLLVTGFGLNDSFSNVVTRQYDNIYKYNFTISCNSDSICSNNDFLSYMNDSNVFSNYTNLYQSSATATNGTKDFDTYITVPEDKNSINQYINFFDTYNGKEINLDDDGVIITQKMAEQLNLKSGDELEFKLNGDNLYKVKISGVMENYVMNNIYMTKDLYNQIVSNEIHYNTIIGTTTENSQEFRDDVSETLLSINDVNSVMFNEDIRNIYNDVIAKLQYIVAVLIITAAFLAFVVLYNLININIEQREKEIGTIKVLGFYNKEVNSYIFRETIILTIIGAIIGLGLGTVLHRFVIVSVEMDSFMFGRTINFLSYIYSLVLTIVFSYIVSMFMKIKLKKVSMTESMKSNE